MPILPRKTVLGLKPYPAPDFSRFDYVRLDFNEHTEGFPEAYPSDVPAHLISAYPEYYEFLGNLCQYYSVAPDTVLLTNGSDEGLFLVASVFIEPSTADIAVISKPCFVVMSHALQFFGATLNEVQVLPDMSFDIERLQSELDKGAKIAMFATPENPTGKILPEETILEWCRRYPDTLFVIDEAYGDFAGTSVIPYISDYSNLMVLRTFSKAWGMAGLRLGLIFAQPYLIDYVNRVRSPFNVNAVAVATAAKLLTRSKSVMEEVSAVMRRKQALESQLAERGHRLVIGGSNSFLLGLGINAAAFEKFARDRGVLVRNRSTSVYPGKDPSPLWGYVRVSTGNEVENKKFLDVLAEYENSFGGAVKMSQACYPDSYVGEER